MDKADILLVEDNDSDAEICMRTLKKSFGQLSMLHVKDGLQALDYLFATGIYSKRRIEDLPELILLDLVMPKIDGLAVLKLIRGDDRTLSVPVVVLTASTSEEDENICREMGVVSYTQKPIDATAFNRAIEKIAQDWLNSKKMNNN